VRVKEADRTRNEDEGCVDPDPHSKNHAEKADQPEQQATK
jgi:hypothetical protein